MKLNKAEFKSLLKECLNELIKEGAFNNVIKEVISKSNLPVIAENKSTTTTPVKQQPQQQVPPMLKEVAANAVSMIDSPEVKNVFQGIFEDTAATTLRMQARGETNPMMTPAMLAENNNTNVDLDALKPKDQPMSHWAKLAFGNKK